MGSRLCLIGLFHNVDLAVIVAVIAVRMMQVAVDQVVGMVAVGNGFMAAIRAVDVPLRMGTTIMAGRAGGRIGATDSHGVLFDRAIRVYMMKMAIMKIIDMIAMLERGVPAAGTVLVGVMGVRMSHRHSSE